MMLLRLFSVFIVSSHVNYALMTIKTLM